MFKNPRVALLFIILITLSSLYIDLPKIKIFGKNLTHPKIDTGFIKRDLEPKLGLDLAGGAQLTMSADMTGIEADKQQDAIESAKGRSGSHVKRDRTARPGGLTP